MTTVGAKVRITGTSGGAVSALNATTVAAGRLNTGLGRLAGVALTAGAGVLGFGAATESARRLVQLARESVIKYSESNTEVAERLAGTREKLDELQESVGRAIIGGDNLEEMTGALNIALSGLVTVVSENENALQAMALGGMRMVINAGFDLSQGFLRLLSMGALFKGSLLVIGDALAIAGAGAAQLAFQVDSFLTAALARAVESAGNAADTFLAFGGEHLPGIGTALEAVSASAATFTGQLDDSADAARRNAEEMANVGRVAREGLAANLDEAVNASIRYGAIADDLQVQQDQLNAALDNGTVAASSFRGAVAGVGEEAQASTEWIGALADRVRGLLGEMDRLRIKREDQKTHAQDMIKAEIDLQAHLDAIKTEAFEADQRRREAEQAATSAAIDGTLAGFGRLASGNDKLTKALNIAAGARLAGQAVFQLNTGVGYALAGSYAQGVALIAQSVVSFAEAAKLGFGGGKKGGGGARQTTTTVNQTNVFAGPVDSDSSQGFLEQLQSATRAGALEGAR